MIMEKFNIELHFVGKLYSRMVYLNIAIHFTDKPLHWPTGITIEDGSCQAKTLQNYLKIFPITQRDGNLGSSVIRGEATFIQFENPCKLIVSFP